ncbi:MAG: urea transporter [Chitinophagaceae bacterium]|nr:MAG: urea transporter [Chitinophagaceae bacterium]
MIKHTQTIFRGMGQVMFQNNVYSGILFFAGIFYNSWILGLAALFGTVISTVTAMILKYPEEDIQNGLYGFNGALTGIAMLFYFGFNPVTIVALIIGAVCSSLLMHGVKKLIPPFTAPFVVVTWVLIILLLFVFHSKLITGVESPSERLSILAATTNGFGQVMFQKNMVTGLFFLLAILINSRLFALYSLYASLLGLLLGWLLSVPLTALNGGLMGYNGILCAIALAGTKRGNFKWVSLAVILSVLLNMGFNKMGMIALTAPFVLSTWIMLAVKSKVIGIKRVNRI